MIKQGICGFMFSCYADWVTRPVMRPPMGGERPAELGYWGMLDQYRRPKLVYDVVRELYGKMSMEAFLRNIEKGGRNERRSSQES